MERVCHLDEMVLGVPIEGTTLLSEQLTSEEIKKCIKARLESVPNDAALDLCPPMCPNHDFIKMVSALLLLVPLVFFLLPDLGLERLQGNLCLVPEFNPPLPEDAALRRGTRPTPRG
jgi:hypothetical protein